MTHPASQISNRQSAIGNRLAHRLLLTAFCLLLLLITHHSSLITAVAQSATATLSGTVVDQNDAVVPAASVSVINAATGQRREATTGDNGVFTVPLLPPATYTIRVEHQGFLTAEVRDIVLNVGDERSLRIHMKVGDVKETVNVTAESPLINESPAVSTVVDRQFVENIPLNGRSFHSLILLTPGVVTNSPQSASVAGFSGEFSVNGQRTETNRFTVDGVSANNGAYLNGFGSGGQAGVLPAVSALGSTQPLASVDALQEFRVESSSYSAEFGRQPGGQFILLTRSGTNQWHGTAFDYFRNDRLDANNWFNNQLGKPRLPERINDFGGTLGGPVMIPGIYNGRNRTFFFFSYEGMRLRQALAANIVFVPGLTLRQQAPTALKPVLNAYPLPSGADLPNGLAPFVQADSLPGNIDSLSARFDHTVASWLQLFFRFSHTSSQAIVGRLTGTLRGVFANPYSYALGATSAINPRLTNEFRLGFSPTEAGTFFSLDNFAGAQPVDLVAQQGIDRSVYPRTYVSVSLSFPSFGTAFLATRNVKQPQHQWNVVDTVSYMAAGHLIKIGADVLQTSSRLQPFDPNININFTSAAAVLANAVSPGTNTQRFGAAYPVYRNFSAYVQDQWRVRSRLTLALGLRWEVNPPVSVASGFRPYIAVGDPNNPATFTLGPKNTQFYGTTYHNFAPRLGVSYVARDKSGFETVLRAGAGVFFDTGHNASTQNFPFSPGLIAQSNYGTAISPASWPLTPAQWNIPLSSSFTPPYRPQVYSYDPHLQLPYTLQWNVGVQQSIGAAQALTVAYVGAVGRRLQQQNQLTISSAVNPLFPAIIRVRAGLTSDYHALQVQFQRRISHGLQALTSYTWSHSIDYGSRDASLPFQRGNSDFDVRHNFNAGVTYDVPGTFKNALARSLLHHWAVDARLFARSSMPITLRGSTLINAAGQQFIGGVNLIPGVPIYLHGSQYPGGRAVNPAAFAIPTGNQQGNAPRNFVRGLDAVEADLSVRRDFPITERLHVRFRVDIFNLLNHPIFGVVNTTVGNPLFGQSTATLNNSLGAVGGFTPLFQQGGPRSIQLSLKFMF